MNKLDIIPKNNLYNIIIDLLIYDKKLNNSDIISYLYILNKNYFNGKIKENFNNYFMIDNKNLIETVLNPFFNKYLINEDIPYTSIQEDYIINQIIIMYNNKYKK